MKFCLKGSVYFASYILEIRIFSAYQASSMIIFIRFFYNQIKNEISNKKGVMVPVALQKACQMLILSSSLTV